MGEATVVALGSRNPSEVGKREYRRVQYLPEIDIEAGTGFACGLRVSLCGLVGLVLITYMYTGFARGAGAWVRGVGGER